MRLRTLADLTVSTLLEAPHLSLEKTSVPDALYPLTLSDWVDVGMEEYPAAYKNWPELDRTQPEGNRWPIALTQGVLVPDTQYRLRGYPLRDGYVELAQGDEVTLPHDWRSYVQMERNKQVVWCGKKVRADRQPSDLENYVDDGEGWKRKDV